MRTGIENVARRPPAIGSRVKVWFDKASGDLIIENAAGERTWDIYGVCLADAVFTTEPTRRGAARCVVTGTFLAVPGSNESSAIRAEIWAASKGPLEFYWWRDKQWPITRSRLAYVAKPHGGFPTCRVVDGVRNA